MSAIKFLIFLAVAVACAFAVEDARVKKDVLIGSPYAYSAYGAYPYSAGYAVPAAYSAYAAPAAYSAYGAYPYAAYPAVRAAGLYY